MNKATIVLDYDRDGFRYHRYNVRSYAQFTTVYRKTVVKLHLTRAIGNLPVSNIPYQLKNCWTLTEESTGRAVFQHVEGKNKAILRAREIVVKYMLTGKPAFLKAINRVKRQDRNRAARFNPVISSFPDYAENR